MVNAIAEAIALILAAAVTGIFAYVRGLASRINDIEKNMAVHEALAKDKHDTLEAVLKATAAHEQRLAIIETVITDLKTLPALLREMVAASTSMKIMLEQHTSRVERLENRIYSKAE